MITSILLATTILVSQPKAASHYPEGTREYAFLGIGTEEKPKPTAATSSVSSSGDVHWVDMDFDAAPSFKKEGGTGYVILNFSNKINFSKPGIPESASKAIKSVKYSDDGNLRVRVDFDPDYYPFISKRGGKVSVEIRKKQQKASEKKTSEKKVDEKKVEPKKEEVKTVDKLADIKVASKKTEDKKAVDKKAEDKAKEDKKKKDAEDKKKKEAELKKAELKKQEEKQAAEKKKEAAKKQEEKKKKEAEEPKPKPELKPEPEPKKVEKVEEPEVNEIVAKEPVIELPDSSTEVFKEAKISFNKKENAEQLKFDFPEMPPAAVFERFGYLWIVFDSKANPATPRVEKSDYFTGAARVKGSGLVLRLPMKKDAVITAFNVGNSWFVEAANSANDVGKNLRASLVGDSWVFTAKNNATSIKLYDEYSDDNIIAIPVYEPRLGSKTQQTNGDFIAGKTAQGLVIRPITASAGNPEFSGDDIKFKKTSTLQNSEVMPVAASASVTPIFQFKNWTQLTGAKFRDADKLASSIGKLEHANFLFSQGLYAEAASRLKGYDSPSANFLRAASQYMAGRYNEAAQSFDAIRLEPGSDQNELLFWKIAANKMLGRYNITGAIVPDTAQFGLPKNFSNYPPNIAAKTLFPVIEHFIDTRQTSLSAELFKVVPKTLSAPDKNYASYLEAKMYAVDNKKARARELWQKVVDSNIDRESRAKALYEIIMQDLADNKIKPEEAAQKLDKLLIVWKGDAFEYNLLNTLAGMYDKQGKNLKALRLYKQAITKFQNFPENDRISEDMKRIFGNALKLETEDKGKIFDDLATYYEFKELVPVGDEGDKITMNLVDKLARYDLFEEAAKVLENYMQTVEDPVKKAEVSTKIAIFYFMNRQPQKALDTLKSTDDGKVPAYLKEERVLISTRSLIDIGDFDAALIAAAGMEDQQRQRLRAEIYWKQSNWEKLVEAYKNIQEKTPDDILKMAIANSVLGNKTNLRLMRGQYGEMMSKTEYADDFEFVSNTENINYRDLAGSLKIDMTADVIKSFKAKIKTAGVKGLGK